MAPGLRRTIAIAAFLTGHRGAVLMIILVLTIVFLFGAVKVRTDLVLQDLFPADHPFLTLHGELCRIFGSGASTVLVCLKSRHGDIYNRAFLAKLQKMTEEIGMHEAVYRQRTASIASLSSKVVRAHGQGEISIAPLMWPDVPQTAEAMARLRDDIFSSGAYHGTFVSRDGTAAVIVTEFKETVAYDQVHRALQHLAHHFSDEETSVHIVGLPALIGWLYDLRPQLLTVFAVSGLLVALALYGLFGNVIGMVVPLANALILTVWGLGFIGFADLNFSPLLYVLAFLVVARVIGNANQILARYFEHLESCENDRARACSRTMETMLIPNLAAVTTDAAGFAFLCFAHIPLMRQVAMMMTFWVFSITLTGILTPILGSVMPLRRAGSQWSAALSRKDRFGRTITAMARLATGRPGRYVVGSAVAGLFLLCCFQANRLQTGDPTPGSPLLWPDHPYNKDQVMLDGSFDTSSENLILLYDGPPGSVYDPAVLNTFDAVESHMKACLPEVYKSSSSVNQMVSLVNLNIHDGDEAWAQIPRNLPAMRFLIGYLRQTAGEHYLSRFIDGAVQRTQMALFFKDHTSGSLARIREALSDFFDFTPVEAAGGRFRYAGGRIGLEMALNEEMERTHAVIDALVLAAIFILCTLFFRSAAAGLLLTLPLLISNMVAFAYMAYHGMGLSINTLPVAAVGAGIGVDFAIYLYRRYQEEFPLQGGDWSKTLEQAACTCGRAVVYTGLTIILPLMSWYFLCDMKFQAQMGAFLALIIAMNVLLALTLHPLMIYLIKPGFISRKGNPMPQES